MLWRNIKATKYYCMNKASYPSCWSFYSTPHGDVQKYISSMSHNLRLPGIPWIRNASILYHNALEMLTSYLYTVYFLIGFSAKTHLQYVSCVLYPPFCCICRMFFNLFFFFWLKDSIKQLRLVVMLGHEKQMQRLGASILLTQKHEWNLGCKTTSAQIVYCISLSNNFCSYSDAPSENGRHESE